MRTLSRIAAGMLIAASVFFAIAAPASGSAAAAANERASSLEFVLGYSPFFVDPHAGMRLSGATGEVRWNFGGEPQTLFSRGFHKRHELTLSAAAVLDGDIRASALGLTYGKRYDFDHLYTGFGFAPFTYVLFPRGAAELEPGYTLDGGPRLAVYSLVGSRFFVTERFGLAIDVKYYFTVRNVYWHNPFEPHAHRDMFNSFVFGVGLIRRGE